MNYENIYNALVEKAKVRGLDKSQHEGYFEIHHIVPRCLGGSDEKDNLIMFTGREHFIAHMLLWKSYPENVSLMRAAFLMSNRKVSKINSTNYESLKLKISEVSSELYSGENNPFYGKRHSEETKLKFKDRPSKKGKDNPNFGKKLSAEHRKIISERQKGIPWSEEKRKVMMASKKYGEDHHLFGKSHPPELLKQISESLKARDQKPWENLATQTEESMTKWSMCDYFYNLWVEFNKPGLKVFTKIYNQTHNDDVSLAFFTNPRLKWLDGWIPKEDPKWVEFSKGF